MCFPNTDTSYGHHSAFLPTCEARKESKHQCAVSTSTTVAHGHPKIVLSGVCPDFTTPRDFVVRNSWNWEPLKWLLFLSVLLPDLGKTFRGFKHEVVFSIFVAHSTIAVLMNKPLSRFIVNSEMSGKSSDSGKMGRFFASHLGCREPILKVSFGM